MRLGIDLGGTKIEVIALSDTGEELSRHRTPSARGDYQGTLEKVKQMVENVDPSGNTPVGFAIPGSVSKQTGLIKNANSTWLIGKPLAQDLRAHLGRDVKLENDANCLIVSEATDGAAAGAEIAFGVIIGTGVGGGIAVNGRPLSGRNGIAGEWGHWPLPWPTDAERPGRDCYCGLSGCIETWLAGPSLAYDHLATTGQNLSAIEIADKAAADDPDAMATLDRYMSRLARGLAQVINLLDPEVIVLGGGVSNISTLYEELPKRWQRWTFSDHVTTEIKKPRHGDSSGVRGAAWLWPKAS